MTLTAGAIAMAVAVWLAMFALIRPTVGIPGGHPEARRLRLAGWPWTAARWEAVRLGVVAAAITAALVVGAEGAALAVAAVLAGVVPSILLRLRADAAADHGRAAALIELRAVESALSSGASLGEALSRAVGPDHRGADRGVLARAVREFTMGAPLSAALRAAAPDADRGARQALLGVALGVDERLPIAQLRLLVGSAVERLGFEEQLATEVRARASGARVQIWAMALLVPALGGYLAMTVSLVAETLSSDLGRHLLLPGAAALEVAGILLARRTVREVIS